MNTNMQARAKVKPATALSNTNCNLTINVYPSKQKHQIDSMNIDNYKIR